MYKYIIVTFKLIESINKLINNIYDLNLLKSLIKIKITID